MIDKLFQLDSSIIFFAVFGISIISFWSIITLKISKTEIAKIVFVGILYFFISILLLSKIYLIFESKTKEKLLGYAPTYAKAFELLGHDKVNKNTLNDDQFYLNFIELEKEWQNVNPYVSDIYTMKKDIDGTIYLMIDSETDYNKNGIFDGDREQRTSIGDKYDKFIPELMKAFEGESTFTEKIYTDKWGTWVSAFVPIKNKNKKIDAVLGVDFASTIYIGEIQEKIFRSLLLLIILFALLSALYIYNVKRIELIKSSTLQKEQFTASISHEIRTPVNGIIGASQILSETKITPDQKQYLEIISSCSNHLLELLNDVLDFSKIQSNKIILEDLDFNLIQLIETTILTFKILADSKSNVIDFKIKFAISNQVKGDPTRIRQILFNLLSNAIKFTEKGKITIVLEKIINSTGEFYKISIKDTGVGIKKEDQKKIFRPYIQADSSTTRKYGGTGLGLAICQQLCELMKGRIYFDSEINVGTNFYIELPLINSNVNVIEDTKYSYIENFNFYALIVDDIKVNQIILSSFLEKLGIKVLAVDNALQAYNVLESQKIDLIFMDCFMPDIDGFECARQITLNSKKYLDPLIIAVTASAEQQDREKCSASGMKLFLTKPVTKESLKLILNEAVKLRVPYENIS